jgi:hypothetical protein
MSSMGAALRDEVIACAERTLAEPRARVEFTREWRFIWPEARRRTRRRGGLLRPVGKLVTTAAKQAGKAAWRHWMKGVRTGDMTASGIIEPPARRHMIDFGSYAEIYKDGTRWGGRSGRPLATLDPWPPDRMIDLWWLLEALLGATHARHEGEDHLYGVTTRRIAADVDLTRASARMPGLRVPSVERFEDLTALPMTVWIDGEHVRRVRFTEGSPPSGALTLDLVEFDPATGDLDWERLPTFRSPD